MEELGAALCVENGNLKAKLSDFEAKFLQMEKEMEKMKELLKNKN